MTHIETAEQVTEVFKVLEVVNPTSIDGIGRTQQMRLAWEIVTDAQPRGLIGHGLGMGWEPVYEVGTTPSTPAAARLDKKHKVKK